MAVKVPQKVKDRLTELIPDSTFENETVKKIKVPNKARKIEFEVGDSKETDFKPQFKTMHWDNECNFSARLVMEDGLVDEYDNKLAYDDGEKIARLYEKDTGDEDGGFEFDVVFSKKPSSNVLTWTLQHKELEFFYQPALTPEEIDEGVGRPENVIGSYAVYHKSKTSNKVGGKEHRTGKAFHIYRPYAEDVNGDRIWADLHVDPDANEMTVTIDQDWLDKAAYPVVVDPTFGYTSAGGSTSTCRNTPNGQSFSLSENGDLTSMSVYIRFINAVRNLTTMIYNSSDSLIETSSGTVVSNNDPQWISPAMSSSLAAASYWLSVWGTAPGTASVYFDSTTGEDSYLDIGAGTYSGGTAPDPRAETTGYTNRNYSIYATYTASGGGSPRRIIIL